MNALSRAQTFYSNFQGLSSPRKLLARSCGLSVSSLFLLICCNFFLFLSPFFRMVTFTLILLMLSKTKAILKGIKYPAVGIQAITAHKRVQQGS
jgi:hypothetical protein